MKIATLATLLALGLGGIATGGNQATLTIDAGAPGLPISPLLYGIFFEETNHSGDGGLYAELVSNRSFEESMPPEGLTIRGGKAVGPPEDGRPGGFAVDWPGRDPLPCWKLVTQHGEGSLALDASRPLNAANPHAARLKIERVAAGGRVGLANEGFWGIPLVKDAKYDFSFYARCNPTFRGPLSVTLEQTDGKVLARASSGDLGPDWRRYAGTLKSGGDCRDARLVLSAAAPGTLWLDMVSLFPRETFKNRPGGLRPDLSQMLADLHPAFLRFPGGCFVEGMVIADALRWKKTIGDIAERPGRWALAGYHSSDGLGYHEYLQLCEDLKAEPLLVINCGMSCQLLSGQTAPLEQLGEWVQDALDAIEYANGPAGVPPSSAGSRWGALRAKNGHPRPFGLKMIEIGNENWGPDYQVRYAKFYHAIKARYPEIKVVADSPTPGVPADLRDDHFYSSPEWFRANAHLYDGQSRDGAKVYVGEYASRIDIGLGNLKGALGEAAFMIGLERNADLVAMASYAPLFVNVHYRGWDPDLINFDQTSCFGTPSYYVQQLFAVNRGDTALPTRVTCPATPLTASLTSGGIGLGTDDATAEFKDVRVIRGDKLLYASDFSRGTDGWRAGGAWNERGAWSVQDGAYRQTSRSLYANIALAFHGDPHWTDVTLKVKARKLGGNGGFLVLLRARDLSSYVTLNFGGSGHAGCAVASQVGWVTLNVGEQKTPAEPIQTGRWYDIEARIQGNELTARLDGRKVLHIQDIAQTGQTMPQIEAIANRVEKSGELIVKAVNFAETPEPVQVEVKGVREVAASGSATTLTSATVTDENTLGAPKKVAPVTRPISGLGEHFSYIFPPHSLTVLRLETK